MCKEPISFHFYKVEYLIKRFYTFWGNWKIIKNFYCECFNITVKYIIPFFFISVVYKVFRTFSLCLGISLQTEWNFPKFTFVLPMKYEDMGAKSILYLNKISTIFCFMFSEVLLKSSENQEDVLKLHSSNNVSKS